MLGCLCRTCLGHNCLVEEKLEFKRGEDVLEKVEKFYYLCDMISCYSEASDAVSARTGSVSKKSRKLSGVLVGRQGLSLKQQEKIYQFCVRPVLLYCCEIWELVVVDELRLHGVEHCIIMMMCGVRLNDRASTDVLCDRVGVVVKIEDVIIQSCLQWYGHAMHGDINPQICEVMEVEITGKRKKGQPGKSWEECIKKDLEGYGLRREDVYNQIKKWQQQIKAKLSTQTSWYNGIKMYILVVVVGVLQFQ